jgi:hypothetical protein
LRWTRNSHSFIWIIASGAGGTGGEQHGGHRCGHPDADRRHGRPHVLHRVVDRETRRHDATRRVDVEADVLLRVLGIEEQELGDDEVRDVILDRVAEEDDPFPEQPRVDVVGTLTAAAGLDDHRNEHWDLRFSEVRAADS